MSEPGWWILLVALVLLVAGTARLDLWSAWMHERLDPWWQRITHH